MFLLIEADTTDELREQIAALDSALSVPDSASDKEDEAETVTAGGESPTGALDAPVPGPGSIEKPAPFPPPPGGPTAQA